MQPLPPDPAQLAALAAAGLPHPGHPGAHLPPPLPYPQPPMQHLPPPPLAQLGQGSSNGGVAGGVAGGGGAPPPAEVKKGTKRAAPASKAGAGGQPKEKKTRSKAACSACKSVKQKCEGPPYIPCRRCELYKLECQFPPGTKTIPRPPDTGTAGASSTAGGNVEASAAMSEKLFEIATRLQSIESALHINRPASPPPSTPSHHPHSPSHSAHSHAPDNDEGADDAAEVDSVGKEVAAAANPMNEVSAALESLGERRVGGAGMGNMLEADYGAPDALRRGVLTPDECQQLFDFFFISLHPWVMMLSIDDDRDAMAVRQKSTLLFHVILLLSTAYSSPFPSQLHLTLVTFVNNIIAPQLLNPQPHELTTDFLRALDLLTIYKPVQFGARRAEGCSDADAMHRSKVNGLASWSIQGIFSRTAERLELSTVVGKFARAYSASAGGTPIPKELVRDLRLYYWLLSNDVHGNVQSGRRCNMEGAQALTTTRLFSSLQLQPYDVRLAASVEMFEVARPILRSYQYERTRRIPRPDLERFNQGMKSFDETWIATLIRQLPVDPLAMTVISPFASFITLQFNTTCYVSWKSTRMYVGSENSSSDPGRPGTGSSEGRNKRLRTDGNRGLTDWEFDGLTRCVKAAEFLVFSLSEESRDPGAWRKTQWEEAERADGYRKLILDEQMVEQSRWGPDAITCIAYIFPLVFLSKLVNDGILTTNLVLLRDATPQPAWLPTQKLPRLLELGATFLDTIATNEHHPSRSQARVLRTLLATGVKGRTLTPSGAGVSSGTSPGGPSNAGTTMSPSRSGQLSYIPPQPASYPDAGPPPQLWPSSSAATAPPTGYAFPPPHGATPPPPPAPAPPVLVPGMDEALGSVLNDFEPLFGDTAGGFWEWGGFGAGAGTPQQQAQAHGIQPGATEGLATDWAGGVPPHMQHHLSH
ncbi:hypothetical protein JCM10213_006156 [Rhodosporidiobolus nylandii]